MNIPQHPDISFDAVARGADWQTNQPWTHIFNFTSDQAKVLTVFYGSLYNICFDPYKPSNAAMTDRQIEFDNKKVNFIKLIVHYIKPTDSVNATQDIGALLIGAILIDSFDGIADKIALIKLEN